MVAFNFNYLANFSVGDESKTVITAFGRYHKISNPEYLQIRILKISNYQTLMITFILSIEMLMQKI